MIYICIPSHNEERTVGVLLWKIRQVMTGFPRDYQILVLDDASTDGTAQVLAPYARILPLVVLRHEQRRGYAASLDELLREAARRSEYPRRDVIVTLQADFTEEPDDIPELLKRIESGADVVTSCVELQPTLPRRIRWTRRLLSRVVRRLGWPESVTDVLSGFRAYRVLGVRKALEARGGARLLEWSDVWAANAALLREVQPHVRRVDEVPVRLRSDRRQRPSRFEPKESAFQLLRLAFGRRAPDAVPPREGGPALVPTAASVVAERGAPRESSQNGGARRDRSGRGGAPPGRRTAAPRTAASAPSGEDATRRSSRPRRAAAEAAAEGAARNGGPRRPRQGGGAPPPAPTGAVAPADALATEAPPSKPARRSRRRRKPASERGSGAPDAPDASAAETGPAPAAEGAGEAPARPKRPRRRGGRGRARGRRADAGSPDASGDVAALPPIAERVDAPAPGAPGQGV